MSNSTRRSTPMRLLSATIAAALIQVGTAALVRWLWSISRGSWDGWAWLTYFVGFCVIAPMAGMLVIRAATSARGASLFLGLVVVGVANAVFALSAHGFEEGGIPGAVYLGAYTLALLLVFGLIALKATSHFTKEAIGPPSVR